MADYTRHTESFDDPGGASKILSDLSFSVPKAGLEFLDRFLSEALREPLPDDILNKLERLSRSVISKSSFFKMLCDCPPVVVRLVRLFSTSHYLSDIIIRDAELTSLLVTPEISCPPVTAARLASDFRRITSSPTDSINRKLDRLRMAKRREILKIGIRDYIMKESLDRILKETSALAQACVESVLKLHMEMMSAKHGAPTTPHVVLALGKLGGSELNYSSDIDLMFLYRDEGQLKKITHHEFFNELAGGIMSSLSLRTREGILYRADARLRPDGNAGPLARGQTSMMHYYETRGQLWERQMLIKARPIAGDMALGETFLSALLPFVYPRSFHTSPLREISRMKWRIEEQQKTPALNIKTCPGGIRDIEFIVQAHQLIHGGRLPELRSTNTLTTLKRLLDAGLLTIQEYETLNGSYTFYRHIEHLLQIDQDLQTHTLNDSPAQWKRLSALCGFDHVDDFRGTLERSRFQVREFYLTVFRDEGDDTNHSTRLVYSETLSKENFDHLEEMGFQAPSPVHRALRHLCFGEFPRLQSNSEQHAFIQLLPKLLEQTVALPDPDHTIINFARIVSRHTFKDQLYKGLNQKEAFLDSILHLSALSHSVTNILCDRPAYLDLLEACIDEWSGGTVTALYDKAKGKEELYALRDLEFMRLLVADHWGVLAQDEVHRQLTALADFVLTQRFQLFFDPSDRIAVVGLGKLGGQELSYKSDLDVVFICHDEAPVDDLIARTKALLIDISQITPRGKLYDIDARLRPEGKQAPLVVTLNRYQEYLANRGMLWEKQALIKARIVCGHTDLLSYVRSFLTRNVFDQPLTPAQSEEIFSMRQKQGAEKASRGDDAHLEFKYSVGGLLDLEYAIQAMQMRHHIQSTNTIEAIGLLCDQGLVGDDSGIQLKQNYRFVRDLEKWNFLLFEKRANKLPSDEKQLAFLARFCKLKSTEALLEALFEAKKQNRIFFSQIIGKLRDE